MQYKYYYLWLIISQMTFWIKERSKRELEIETSAKWSVHVLNKFDMFQLTCSLTLFRSECLVLKNNGYILNSHIRSQKLLKSIHTSSWLPVKGITHRASVRVQFVLNSTESVSVIASATDILIDLEGFQINSFLIKFKKNINKNHNGKIEVTEGHVKISI